MARKLRTTTSGTIRTALTTKTNAPDSLTLLGGGPMPQLSSPDQAVLETFVSPSSRDYEVTFFTKEFTSHCPVTGQPDFAEITIRYTPDRRCI
ncbi:MAG: preQ(1) synthase, partial [Chthoniobacterales bacterium]